MIERGFTMFRIALKSLREKEGLSQYAFAKKFGVSQSTVGMWESGKREPNFTTLNKLAKFFRVSTDYLLNETDEQSFPHPQKNALPELSTEEALLIASKNMLGRTPTKEELRKFLNMSKAFFDVKD